ncbi:MAG: VWA domain-containing protein, partial [Proteobacteria bacterium]|nr:VWA domain-containing protein [Pseudomonadota bacterium]
LNPRIKSLQVRVLLTKRDLNDLIVTLEVVLEAMQQSKLTSLQFFDALQGVITQTVKGDKITLVTAQKLAESGLMPNWINSLPYKSKLLEMNNESFAALSAEKRANLEHEIEAKLQFYREINENTDLWTKLDERNDNDIDSVYPLNLDTLP